MTVRTSVVEKVYLDKGFQYDKATQNDPVETIVEPAKKRFSGSESVINKKRSGTSVDILSTSKWT